MTVGVYDKKNARKDVRKNGRRQVVERAQLEMGRNGFFERRPA